MKDPYDFLAACAFAIVTIATVTDLKSRKIPNKLTFPASFAGIVAHGAYYAYKAAAGSPTDILIAFANGAFNGVLGWITGVFIMSITKVFLRKFGHGDTKLVAAVGSFLGPGQVLLVYFHYSIVFGLFWLVQQVYGMPWRELFKSAPALMAGVKPPSLSFEKLNKINKATIPVAPFIALGTISSVLLRTQTLQLLGIR